MDSFLAFLHNNGLLVDMIAMKVGLHGSSVVLATMCYRSCVGRSLKPYDRLFSHMIIASVVSYMVGEIFPYKNITYGVSFIIGLMSDSLSTKLTADSTQSEVLSTLGTVLKFKFFELMRINKEKLEKDKVLPNYKLDEQKKSEEDENDAKKDKDDKEEIEKRLRRKNRTTKH